MQTGGGAPQAAWVSRLKTWLITTVFFGLVLLLLDPVVQWAFVKGQSHPSFLDSIRIWTLGGDLFIFSATLAIVALSEAGSLVLTKAPIVICLLTFTISLGFLVPTTENYRDAVSEIYTEAYVHTSKPNAAVTEMSREQRGSMAIEAASWATFSHKYGQHTAVIIVWLSGLCSVAAVSAGGIIVARR